MKVFNLKEYYQPHETGIMGADRIVARAAEEAGLRLYALAPSGSGVRLQLRLNSRRSDGAFKFQRLDRNGRGHGKVCWHGHKAFFDRLFVHAPNARVRTSLANFNGREDYESKVGALSRNWGYRGGPSSQLDRCTCPKEAPADAPDQPFRLLG